VDDIVPSGKIISDLTLHHILATSTKIKALKTVNSDIKGTNEIVWQFSTSLEFGNF
jgi:hypothetical protein